MADIEGKNANGTGAHAMGESALSKPVGTAYRNGNGHQPHRHRLVLDASEHVVHFYERDESLVDSLAAFVVAGLDAGAACVVVATEAHRRQLAARLADGGRDLDEARAQGTFIALDAAKTLARFMAADGMPDPTRFREVIGAVIARAAEAAGSGERVRIFGEMVALLWDRGNPGAAIRLEELWNGLAAGSAHPISLFCAYPIQSFASEAYGEAFGEICANHTRVIPDESYSALTNPDERLRAIARLQQKAASLEAEIAERKAVEDRLRISENRYRKLFESSTDGILMIDPDSCTVIEANPVMTQLLGSPSEQLLGRELWQIGLFPDQQAVERFMQAVHEQDVVRYETLPLPLSGDDEGNRYVELAGSQFRANGHDVVQCHLREITQRKRAEVAAAHLAAIVTSAEDAIASKTLEGIVTSWNASAERMFGYTAHEMIGQPITRLFPPDRLDEEDLILARIRAGQRIEHFETVRKTKEGRLLDVSLTISPIRDSSGTIIGASKIVRDITERKRAEEALRESEERLRFIAESMPQKIFTAKPNGDVDYFNPQWMEFTGLAFEEIRHRRWAGVLHPDDLDETLARWRRSIETGEPFYGEHRFRRAGGDYRWHVSRAIPIRDDDGRITMWIGSATDIDEQKQLEERQNTFISMASHELKTPVTSLTGFTQILRRRLSAQADADSQTLRFLERMDAQLNKLASLIGDLLDVSRMQTGALAYRQTRFDLDALVRETVENVQAATTTHYLRLEGATCARIVGDQDRLGQVLVNLLTNAIKYSPQADTVVVRLDADRECAHVSVQDFGIGIAPDDHEHIFDRFYQAADREHNTYPGLGIGLYIARTIVDQHGGRLWLESGPGAGSTFHVSLPLAQTEDADADHATHATEEE